MREWLIKKLIGNKPVIANVTLSIVEIKASEPKVLLYKSLVKGVRQ
ncbi:hypothetical protein H1D32_13425 [Anaerobacillus sp. CMMVII]|nr:hypothetical protein [Anaerobacillus sp. CMMVII]MCT8138655.1 hypothetical protein [Anaerobacillus sp. CMMVII]